MVVKTANPIVLKINRGPSKKWLLPVALALTLGVVAPLQAETSKAAATKQEHLSQKHEKHHMQKRAHKQSKRFMHAQHHRADKGLRVPGYGAVGPKTLADLSLTDAQQKKLEEAREAQKALRDHQRQQYKEAFSQQAEQLKKGKVDPKKRLSEREAIMADLTKMRQDADKKWLAMWDSLSADQQSKVVEALKHQTDWRAKKSSSAK